MSDKPEPSARTLVVDDEPMVRDVVARILAQGGMAVETAETAEQALERFSPGRFDLIVTDLRMPGAGGFHLLAEVKRQDPSTPVILLTAFGDVQASVEALRLGADDFLGKPIKMSELRHVCQRAVEKGRLLRENLAQKDRLEHLYAVKSRFLAGMSHELRTPLTTIIGMGEILQDQTYGDLNAKQGKYVTTLVDSARHLLQLINDILDYSKVEAGRLELEPSAFPVSEAMRAAISLVDGLAVHHGTEVQLVEPPTGTTLHADRNKVVQILVNLLSNAIKFSPEEMSVELSCRVTPEQLRFAVVDRGIGIPAESLDAVFEEFQQVSTAGAGKPPGTGLGLALSRRLARMHGGDVQVQSVFGIGSTFTLVLPRVATPEAALAGAP